MAADRLKIGRFVQPHPQRPVNQGKRRAPARYFYLGLVGAEGISMVGDLNIPKVKEALAIRGIKVKVFGEELMIEGYV